MPIFYDNIDHEDALQVEQLTRLVYELRENTKGLLARYQVNDAEALLARIRSGELAEHPTYDHYLSLLSLADLRQGLRNDLAQLLKKVNG